MKSRTNKRILRSIGITFFLLIFFLAAAYIGLSQYYKKGFSYGTWINGIYCTGKDVKTVNEELLKDSTYEGLTVYGKNGYSYPIRAKDIGYAFDFKEALTSYLDRQNPYLWIHHLLFSKEYTLVPVVSYDEEKLSENLGGIPFLTETKTDGERDVSIIKTNEGYQLVNERLGVLNMEKARTTVEKALLNFDSAVNLEEEKCYEDLPLSAEMEKTMDVFRKIDEFQNCGIVYQFGEELVPVNAAVVCDWIAQKEDGSFIYDENGNLTVDDRRIEEFVERLADEYDTLGGSRWFEATGGQQVKIEGGTYGNKIDRKAEKKYLKEAFHSKAGGLHTPEYTHKALVQGKNDIGRTYIEVDMTKQKLYFYKEGRLEVETEIVTGNTGRRMGTPEGVNFVYGKQENRILRGPGYASHVNFWMPVKGNIGIHDAAWRSEFGGEIYKTGGSHGCINTPYEEMSRIYEMAEVGTPVVMFY